MYQLRSTSWAGSSRRSLPRSRTGPSGRSAAEVRPQAPVHVLVIPKGRYVCFDHFAAAASADEIADFTRAAAEVCRVLGVEPGAGGAGYRVIANSGPDSHQEVPHYHMHILAGRPLGAMLVHPA